MARSEYWDPEALLPGGDQPGDRPRFPAGAPGGLGGQWVTTESLRRTGYGYMAIRYSSRFPGIIHSLDIRAGIVERETAEAVRDDAAAMAPVGTEEPYLDEYGQHPGILRDSLYVDEHIFGGYVVATDVHYAPFIEFGYTHVGGIDMPAKPFLIPAMRANEEAYIARMAAGLQAL